MKKFGCAFILTLHSTNTTDDGATSTSSILSSFTPSFLPLAHTSSPSSTPAGYTSAEDPPSRTTNTAAIAAGVVGGVILVVLVILTFLWHRRRLIRTHPTVPSVDDAIQDDKIANIRTGARGRRYYIDTPVVTYICPGSRNSLPELEQASSDSPSERRQNIRTFRKQVDASGHGSGPARGRHEPHLNSPHSTARDPRSLHEPIEQPVVPSSAPSPRTAPLATSPELLREVALLRAETEAIRLRQDTMQDPLPSYSPPPWQPPASDSSGQDYTG